MKNYAVYRLKYGNFLIEEEGGAITGITITDENTNDFGTPTPLTDSVAEELSEYFSGKRKEFTFKYELHGTEFQKKVWQELTKIPYGETRTYGQIAAEVGNPKASRAVGMANNRNPIVIAVPCHRVIGANGSLTGYAYGIEMKENLLKMEKENI